MLNEVYTKGNSEFLSEWFSTGGVTQPINLIQNYSQAEPPISATVTLVLSVGLEFGKQGVDGNPEVVKYAGCGKILRVG